MSARGERGGALEGIDEGRADGRTLGGERSERARVRVQHEASGDDGRPTGGRQTECSRVSGTLTRRAVCWPASRLAGAATGGVRSRESRAAALLQRRSETVEGRMGGQTRAARGRDRGGGRPDAMALREGRRTVAADMAGGNSSRCGRTLQQRATVTYRPDPPRGSARSPLTSARGPIWWGHEARGSVRASFRGGVVGRTV